MPLAPGRHELGPADGSLLVKTFREGVAARVGHDLVLEVTRWHAVVDGGSIAVTADPASLEVRAAHNGLKPMTDGDRREIRRNIDEKVLGGRSIAFTCDAVSDDAAGLIASGQLTIGGVTRPVRAALTRTPEKRLQGTIALRQSEFGIKPYKGLMGALRVRDDIEILVDIGIAT
jgi:polyisoprenoid-binding protein YceI